MASIPYKFLYDVTQKLSICLFSEINVLSKSQSVFALLTRTKFAKPYTTNNVTPNTGKIAMKLTEMSWNPTQKMFVLIKVS